jgi:hypothetical protein
VIPEFAITPSRENTHGPNARIIVHESEWEDSEGNVVGLVARGVVHGKGDLSTRKEPELSNMDDLGVIITVPSHTQEKAEEFEEHSFWQIGAPSEKVVL